MTKKNKWLKIFHNELLFHYVYHNKIDFDVLVADLYGEMELLI
ncbi:hypothetical protein AtDm6_3390 [Acetobacter tropicalis]|uniref:Uncharacterized protein n=1 Tax=Acetobacter tropicalis TaxID=104102 RepID=A0A094YHS2_9PROT|nr:hypothetical protein AmDm5_0570 [Acetobacter malorum]KGB20872.1 hypothetical protein AtDm6_3390 [Acetobacter tropicalis]